jgi:hypothetical protein
MNISLERRIIAFSSLAERFKEIAEALEKDQPDGGNQHDSLFTIQSQCTQMNPWFTKENIVFAFHSWSRLLNKRSLENWLKAYNIPMKPASSKTIAVINAGNIPLVGFHDFLSVLLSGNNYLAKNASDDSILLPYIASLLIEIEPDFKSQISFTEKLSNFDAVIATGSNNSSRYFNYYFGKYPHIIRKNRNAIAVLTESESEDFFKPLAEDIFRYFGLGCRNVSKLYVPEGYNFDKFFKSIYDWNSLMQHNKYMNNFEHHNAVLLLKRIPFLQNGFLIVMENPSFSSPVAVLNYEYYSDTADVLSALKKNKENIQCIVTNSKELLEDKDISSISFRPGRTQEPGLSDYADGVDTMRFLLGL